VIDLVGIALFCFVKESLEKNISNIETSIVKTGLLGTAGNKGSVFLRFSYLDTNFAFACAHLAAGPKKNKDRITELIDIMHKPLLNPIINKEVQVRDHDVNFIFGDLNFRVDLEYKSAKSLVLGGEVSLLWGFEQFLKEKLKNKTLSILQEGPLTFLPTYKFDVNTNKWDTSKKQRTPSWYVLFV